MKLFSFNAQNASFHAVLAFKVLLRNLLLFSWVYLYMLFDFSFLQPSKNSSCFNNNMPWTGSILIMYVWCPGGFLCGNQHPASLSQDLGNFLLLFC
jgi:hypothetical protein